jgi:hypothetical protein
VPLTLCKRRATTDGKRPGAVCFEVLRSDALFTGLRIPLTGFLKVLATLALRVATTAAARTPLPGGNAAVQAGHPRWPNIVLWHSLVTSASRGYLRRA